MYIIQILNKIFFSTRGQIKLADFGLARLYNSEERYVAFLNIICTSDFNIGPSERSFLPFNSIMTEVISTPIFAPEFCHLTKIYFEQQFNVYGLFCDLHNSGGLEPLYPLLKP